MNNNKNGCTFLWFIENLSYSLQKGRESLVSPVFTASELEGTSWILRLYRQEYGDMRNIYIFLHRHGVGGPDFISINYHISLVYPSGSTIFLREGAIGPSEKTYTNLSFDYSNRNSVWADTCMTSSRLKDACLPKDILTVCCKLRCGKGNEDNVTPICARTRIGIERISYLHTEKCFSALEPDVKKTVHIRCRSKKGSVISSNLYYSNNREKLMLQIISSYPNKILAKCELSVLQASGKIRNLVDANNQIVDETRTIETLELPLTKREIMDNKSIYLPGDKLSLLCDCIFQTGIEFERIEESQQEIITTSIKESGDYPNIKDLYREKMSACPSILEVLKDVHSSKFLTDVELKTKANSYPAHKVVLCARSPVFKAMMSNGMKEKNSGSIPVDDLEDDTVQQLLLFLYTDNLEDLLWETATKLYYAADKYQIEKIRLISSAFLIDNLTTSTATELLLLADTHSDSDLKKVVEDFILKHDEQVFGSNKWEALVESNPQLALKTMHLKYKRKEGNKIFGTSENLVFGSK